MKFFTEGSNDDSQFLQSFSSSHLYSFPEDQSACFFIFFFKGSRNIKIALISAKEKIEVKIILGNLLGVGKNDIDDFFTFGIFLIFLLEKFFFRFFFAKFF